MKKVITIITAALMMAATATAQTEEGSTARNSSYKKGYHFSVELGMGLSDQMSIATSHGYNFGNGFYIGGGAAFMEQWTNGFFDGEGSSITPVFAEAKYSLLNTLVSPYIDMRAGAVMDISGKTVRMMIAPSLGFDIACVSVGVGYAWHTINNSWHGLTLSVGVGF